MRTTLFASVFFFAVAGVATAQSASCVDVADEPHHQLLFQNQDVRVLVLELPRLAATESHCHPRPYLDIIATESKSSNTLEGHAPVTRDWNGPEAHFVYSPMQHVVRNESMTTYRELIVETMHPANYQPFDGAYDTDLFPGDLARYQADLDRVVQSRTDNGVEESIGTRRGNTDFHSSPRPIGPDRPGTLPNVGHLCSKPAS